MCTSTETLAKAEAASFVHTPGIRSRFFLNGKPALHSPCATTLPRPPHPIPTSVTIAIRPSLWDGMARDKEMIWVRRKREYFLKQGSTPKSPDRPPEQIGHQNAINRMAS
jgi:hypothetical protein